VKVEKGEVRVAERGRIGLITELQLDPASKRATATATTSES
jgi:tricorn protease-like protein